MALEAGQKPLAEILEKASSSKMVSGADAFLLYDTYGFPLEITVDAAADRGIQVKHPSPLFLTQYQEAFPTHCRHQRCAVQRMPPCICSPCGQDDQPSSATFVATR